MQAKCPLYLIAKPCTRGATSYRRGHRHNAVDAYGKQQPQRKKPRMSRTQAINPRFESRSLEQASVDNFFSGSNR